MLFNSYPFLFVFLPVALLGYQVAGWVNQRAVVAWLGIISLTFYAYWHPAFLIVLLSSILFNYAAAAVISGAIRNRIPTVVSLWAAIFVNLAALGYFKYFFPSLNFLGTLFHSTHHWADVALPLGISFFTFTQIAFLVDLQQGVAKHQGFTSYLLFVTFFPHLIAGPILHHKEMMPQFKQHRRSMLRSSDVAIGFSWFIMGVGKKVLIADVFAKSADAIYHVSGPVPMLAAWRGILCYALQLYFDFSGYSDMAIGLARMFSIDFPLNFNSPYKAANVIDFWQRWHMTLSQYITNYLYTPISFWVRGRRRQGGKAVNRASLATPGGFGSMIAFPMVTTMFIAGIWHGAGLQFIVFGVLHGLYLTVNHAWNIRNQEKRLKNPGQAPTGNGIVSHISAVLLTFLCVLIAQVFFRAASVSQACSMLAGAIGLHGLGGAHVGLYKTEVASRTAIEIVLGLAIVWFLPNTQQILSHFKPSLQADSVTAPQGLFRRLSWQPSVVWLVALAFVLFFSLVHMQDPSTFLYFQF